MKKQFHRSSLVLLAALIVSSCGMTGQLQTRDRTIIRPLDSYHSPICRDLAQFLYPGFQTIAAEIQTSVPDNTMLFMEHGLGVVQEVLPNTGQLGYYIRTSFLVTLKNQAHGGFVEEAEKVVSQYLSSIFTALSSDWNHIFSPSISGVLIVMHWKSHGSNSLKGIFANKDVQKYLNAQMSLQELVDKNWIEGQRNHKNFGRIELNALQLQESCPYMALNN